MVNILLNNILALVFFNILIIESLGSLCIPLFLLIVAIAFNDFNRSLLSDLYVRSIHANNITNKESSSYWISMKLIIESDHKQLNFGQPTQRVRFLWGNITGASCSTTSETLIWGKQRLGLIINLEPLTGIPFGLSVFSISSHQMISGHTISIRSKGETELIPLTLEFVGPTFSPEVKTTRTQVRNDDEKPLNQEGSQSFLAKYVSHYADKWWAILAGIVIMCIKPPSQPQPRPS